MPHANLDEYQAMTVENRLRYLAELWQNNKGSPYRRGFIEGRMIELTIGLEECPEDFHFGCLCDTCRSYE